MTMRVNARIAGTAFLAYIAIGITQMLLSRPLSGATEVAARLTLMGEHLPVVRINLLLTLVTAGIALALAVSLHALTREVDRDVARFALLSRAGEALMGAITPLATLALIRLATAIPTEPQHASARELLGSYLFQLRADDVNLGAILFACGSTAFSWLFLKGGLIPRPLAWLGIVASLLLVVGLPLQLVGIVSGPIAKALWLPAAAFEIPLGIWLLAKGVRSPEVA